MLEKGPLTALLGGEELLSHPYLQESKKVSLGDLFIRFIKVMIRANQLSWSWFVPGVDYLTLHSSSWENGSSGSWRQSTATATVSRCKWEDKMTFWHFVLFYRGSIKTVYNLLGDNIMVFSGGKKALFPSPLFSNFTWNFKNRINNCPGGYCNPWI